MKTRAADPSEFTRRARALRWLLCDVDGVLTDGRLYYGASSEPAVAFDIKDGLALRLAQRGGLKVGVLTGRASRSVGQRARNLGLDLVLTGREDKGMAFREWLGQAGEDAAAVAYIGDDLLDLPILMACGLALAPADAVDEVRAAAPPSTWCSSARAGTARCARPSAAS
jgi:3-deoxy-D-manno-octulosonate 8-phosphate phosphatase (KDO 8-P phosphatase)